MAIQIALSYGADVFATDSAVNLRRITRLDATAIDYATESVDEYVAQYTDDAGFDVIFDGAGGATIDASFAAVKRYMGHVVSALGWGTHGLAPLSFRGATYSGHFTLQPMLTGEGLEHHGEILGEATAMADAGRLTSHLDSRRYTLETVADAHASVAGGASEDKVIVDVAQD